MSVLRRLLVVAVVLVSSSASTVADVDGKKKGRDLQSAQDTASDHLELDPNPHLACSACEAITYIIMAHLQSARYETRAKTVDELDGTGTMRTVPYMKSATHVETVVSGICDSADMSLLKKKQGWLGQSRYEFDDIPSYRQDYSPQPSLERACRMLTQGPRSGDLKRLLLSAIRRSETAAVPAVLCVKMLSVCKWKLSRSGVLKAGLEEAFLHDPSVVARLLPFAVLLGCLPFVLLPLFVDSPPPRNLPPPGEEQGGTPEKLKAMASHAQVFAETPGKKGKGTGPPAKGKKKRT